MDGPRTESEVAQVLDLLDQGSIEVVGRVVDASNLAVLVDVVAAEGSLPQRVTRRAIYKPVRGERPLWDFPEGTLAGREVASWVLSRALGYGVVPPTVLREGPYGVGSVQLWIGDPFAPTQTGASDVVRVVPAGRTPPGWVAVVDGEGPGGRAVTVVHEDAADLRGAAVLDAVLNNSDRKGSHLVRDGAGVLWGFDHGLTLHEEPKLRTVLWGWAGQPLREQDLTKLAGLEQDLADAASALRTSLDALLPGGDVRALAARVGRLRREGIHPRPGRGWPALPWPPL